VRKKGGYFKMKKVFIFSVIMMVSIIMAFSIKSVEAAYGGNETITLNAPLSWATLSPSTKLSAFNYTAADISSMLIYDAAAGAFEVPAASDLLIPLNVFFVYPNKETSVSFTYETYTPGMITKNLLAGWNSVGTNTGGKAIDEFSTIQSSVSTLYVPGSLNARKDTTGDSWGTDADRDLDKTSWPTTLLNSHDGYWIFLTSAVDWTKILD